MAFNIWEGIYKSFAECPKCGEGFASERWALQETERINKLKAAIKNSKTPIVGYKMSLLPFLAALVSANSKEHKVKILDFGGGLGSTYLYVTSGCIERQIIDFFIVDSGNICRKGKELFKNDNKIHFYSSLPKDVQSFDIIHLGSSIQYVEDWKQLLRDFAKYNAEYILFADLPAGKIPTYATVQNYYESKIPYWFFNTNDIIDTMNTIDYTLLFKSAYIEKRLGKKQPLPQDNFPAEYRAGDSCNMLFIRNRK
jgi:putative methyltransferase (TIGR04325 family)